MKRNASQIAKSLINRLWEAYSVRVPYVKTYTRLVDLNWVFAH